jgi:hypothetical protein
MTETPTRPFRTVEPPTKEWLDQIRAHLAAGYWDLATARLLAEIDRLQADRDELLTGVECVLLDHADEIYGPAVDPNIAELAYRYLATVGDEAPVEIRNAVAANAADVSGAGDGT